MHARSATPSNRVAALRSDRAGGVATGAGVTGATFAGMIAYVELAKPVTVLVASVMAAFEQANYACDTTAV